MPEEIDESVVANDAAIRSGMEALKTLLGNAKRSDGKPVTDDMSIYRYMKKDHFLDMVENRRIAFAHISLWEDPFEGFLFKADGDGDARRNKYAGFYGQSWTFGKYESDLRWRAYCPDKDGVRIETTVGDMRNLLADIFFATEAYIQDGPVIYFEDKNGVLSVFHNMVSNDIFPKDRKNVANMLFLKNRHFRSENEYRIICHIGHAGLGELADRTSQFERSGGLLNCKYPTVRKIPDFIKSVRLDPRMSVADVDRLKCRLVQSGCNWNVVQSDVYRWPDFKID